MNKVIVIFMALFFSWSSVSAAVEPSAWKAFRDHFISPDGRVIDYVNGRITTSEGQSYAMLVALSVDDRQAFDIIWTWTKNNLQVRSVDSLLAWKWGERLPGTWDIIDLNNAADADILTAIALLDAAEKWKDGSYRTEAVSIMKGIRNKLIIEKWDRLFLLPGYFGFTPDTGPVINPSYLIIPSFKKFAAQGQKEFWDRLYADSLFVLYHSTFGKYNLPADWITWNQAGPRIDTEKGAVFGYEAIRVVLYLSWDRNLKVLKGLGPYLDFIEQIGYMPSAVNLSEDTISLHEASGGFYAVMARAAMELGRKEQYASLRAKAGEKISYEKDDYYSNILYLLSDIRVN
ncbi:MAG: glycosyl hydrolase family 8 [Nitrospirota bacterium]